MKSFYYTLTVVLLSLSLNTGCSVSKLLVGQVDPVDQRSNSMNITPLESINPNWNRINNSENNNDIDGMPDRAWQSNKTASVISINSACRQSDDESNKFTTIDAKEISNDLVSQWNDVENKIEKDFKLSGFPALETTAEGIYLNRKRKFQTVVVKTPSCVYDLIFLSTVKNFNQDLVTFHQFRDKLIIK